MKMLLFAGVFFRSHCGLATAQRDILYFIFCPTVPIIIHFGLIAVEKLLATFGEGIFYASGRTD